MNDYPTSMCPSCKTLELADGKTVSTGDDGYRDLMSQYSRNGRPEELCTPCTVSFRRWGRHVFSPL